MAEPTDLAEWLDEDAQQVDDAPLPANTDDITLTPGPRLDMLTAKMALEVAAGLIPLSQIFEDFNLTTAQGVKICKSAPFRELYADAKLATGGGLETTTRGRLKADMVIEDGLLKMHSIIQDVSSSSANATDAFRAVTAISSHAVKNRPASDDADAAKGFVLNITLAGEDKPVTI